MKFTVNEAKEEHERLLQIIMANSRRPHTSYVEERYNGFMDACKIYEEYIAESNDNAGKETKTITHNHYACTRKCDYPQALEYDNILKRIEKLEAEVKNNGNTDKKNFTCSCVDCEMRCPCNVYNNDLKYDPSKCKRQGDQCFRFK